MEFITSLTNRYSNILPQDTLRSVGNTALWDCLRNYDPSFGQAVASSLYRFVVWGCYRAIQNQQRNVAQTYQYNDKYVVNDIIYTDNTTITKMMLDEYLSLLSKRDRRIVEAKFLKNYTLQEIGVKEGYSKQGIKHIIDRAIKTMSEAAATA